MSTPTPVSSASDATAAVTTGAGATPRSVWPFLLSLSLIAGLAELAYAIVNVSALPIFLQNGLLLPDLVGLSLTAFYLSEAVFNSPMGTLADKVGRRRLMVFGALVSVLTCIATSFLRLPRHHGEAAVIFVTVTVVCLRILDGMGAAALWPAVFASIGDRVPAARQASAMSVLNITYMVGLAFGPKVGGYLNDTLSERISTHGPVRYMPSFFAAALCFLFAGCMAYLVAPRKNEEVHHAPDSKGVAEATATNAHEGTFSLAAVRSALRRVPILMLIAFITFLGIGLIAPNVKLYAMDRFHISEDTFGTLLLYPALLIAALSLPLGRLGDKWGKTRSIHLGMAICALSLWSILRIQSEWVIVVIGSLLGIGFVFAFPAYMAFLTDITKPEERGGVIGAIRMAQGVGAMIGAAGGSFLFNHVGHQTPFVTAAAFLTLAFVAGVFFIKEVPPAPTPSNAS